MLVSHYLTKSLRSPFTKLSETHHGN